MNVRRWADDTFAEAFGRAYRRDPVLPGTGGPAGNARLTAWTGFLLLALFTVEVGTVFDLGHFLNWHIVVGMLLVPLALLKTASTGWRILGYYTWNASYRSAGPPPMLLRLLGPWVVLATLATLGSGIALVALGPTASRTGFLTISGYHLDAVGVHKIVAAGWVMVIGLHVAGRLIPALRIVTTSWLGGPHIPGGISRLTVIVTTLVIAAFIAGFVLGLSNQWIALGVHIHHG